jgi:hypothetical protein
MLTTVCFAMRAPEQNHSPQKTKSSTTEETAETEDNQDRELHAS